MERQDSLSATAEYPHPFFHEVKLTRAQRIRGLLLGTLLFPLRVSVATLCLLAMWPLARLRFAGLPAAEHGRPVTGWRRWLLHLPMLLLSRAVFLVLGFPWVEVRGRRAGLHEAPVLVVAPHSSFLDMLVLCVTQLAACVSRSENASLPVIGALLEFNQSVLVSRKDPESRRRAVAQINQRLTSNGYWPQMLMFAEGTTTNGSALIKFKPGAFLAGVPVQPVLLRYPNKLDTVRWTYKGTTWLEALWHTTSQLYTNMTIEFLPVYTPSQKEKMDPNLYADNVQKLMARELGLPATAYVMEGGVPVSKLGGLSVPLEPPARDAFSLLHSHGLGAPAIEAGLSRVIDRCQLDPAGWKANAEQLASLLGVTESGIAASICSLYTKDDLVDLRQIYLSMAAVSGFVSFPSLLRTAFCLFDKEGQGSLDAVELSDLMGALLGLPQYNTTRLYSEAAGGGRLTQEALLRVLTTHLAYRRLVDEYLRPEEAGSRLANGRSVNNNINTPSGSLLSNKKTD